MGISPDEMRSCFIRLSDRITYDEFRRCIDGKSTGAVRVSLGLASTLADAEFVNKRNAEKGLPPVEPLYTLADATNALRLFQTVEYDRPTEILSGVRLAYRDAGHILGSASVTLEIADRVKIRILRDRIAGRWPSPGTTETK